MMDRNTFDLFYEGDRGTETNVEKNLCLTSEENKMFEYLKENNLRFFCLGSHGTSKPKV